MLGVELETSVFLLRLRSGQRLMVAPVDNRKAYGFRVVDGRIAATRTADVFSEQMGVATASSNHRGREATIVAENRRIITP